MIDADVVVLRRGRHHLVDGIRSDDQQVPQHHLDLTGSDPISGLGEHRRARHRRIRTARQHSQRHIVWIEFGRTAIPAESTQTTHLNRMSVDIPSH
ncbi:hypothetical protein GCM10027169_09640 [Gordonia jinhuaensis]|uniref:Uncharacterized protein n=1 Tax=Gordonia jinhuaensis TaxID=1517702 RepID=A0A916SUR6_9ACTN|nr:hypothetical protein GCM10011489_03800 [Gordonia jinhuaensis]